MMKFQNIVIGEPICEPWLMFANTPEDWEENEKKNTLFTDERFLPRILVMCEIAKSVNEVRKNKPDLVKTLDSIDFIEVKWGKKRLFVQIGN